MFYVVLEHQTEFVKYSAFKNYKTTFTYFISIIIISSNSNNRLALFQVTILFIFILLFCDLYVAGIF